MPSGPPTGYEIRKIARRTVNIIVTQFGANVCLLGSAACALWADIKRVPNDIDILVTSDEFEQFDPEAIKRGIVDADSRYYLLPSKNPSANYQVLVCRLPGYMTDGRCVKVDILVPVTPTLCIPRVFWEDISSINDIPVMPLFDLLVMKMQGWRDHSASRREGSLDKKKADVTDIGALLVRARWEGILYGEEYHRHTRSFMAHARQLALDFVEECGKQTEFQELGFPMQAVRDQHSSPRPALSVPTTFAFVLDLAQSVEWSHPPVLRCRPVVII